MSERNWFYVVGQDRQGPIVESALRAMIAVGRLAGGTLIWTEQMTQWQPAGNVPEFAGLFAAAPPPLPAGAAPISYAVPIQPSSGDIGQDAGIRMLLPVGRSGWAIAAGYLGLFSVLLIPAPFALITGIIAIVRIRRDPNLHGMGRAIFGVVMGGVFSVFLVIMLAAMATNHHP
jgi:hypothetical protein